MSGCTSAHINKEYTVFPYPPKFVEISEDPVISYDRKNKTFVVTDEFMARSVQQELYVRRVLEWKKVNQVD